MSTLRHASPSPLLPPALSKEEINALPVLSYEGDVWLITTEEQLQDALDRLSSDALLGFDTESRPSFKKGKIYPPSLIQLAGSELVVLIQLKQVPLQEALATLLASPNIIKTGVAIHDDMTALQRLYSFQPQGLADLALMAKQRGIKAQGLRTLAASLMGGRISKAAQCSNWSKKCLTPQQIRYAATDAWVGRELYLKLQELG